MNSDLVRAMRLLETQYTFHSYRFAEERGYPDHVLEGMEDRMLREIGLPTQHIADIPSNTVPNAERLAYWEGEIDALREHFQDTPIHRETVAAYEADDQVALIKLIPQVFYTSFLGHPAHFHGVYPRKVTQGVAGLDFGKENPRVAEYVPPAEYALRLRTMQRDGVLPSVGQHGNLDDKLRPVFGLPDYEQTYGIGVLVLPKGHRYAVFEGRAVNDEQIIYSPRLVMPWLLLKSDDFFNGPHLPVQDNDREAGRNYRHAVEHALRDSGANFDVVGPRYRDK